MTSDSHRPDERFRPGTVELSVEDDVAIVRLTGEHDLATRPALEERLNAIVDERLAAIVDLRDTEFLDAAILNALVSASHRLVEARRAPLVLFISTECRVKRALELSGLLAALPTASSLKEALEKARSGES